MRISILLLLTISALAQLPDKKLTPGAVRTTDQQEICSKTFHTSLYRNTSDSLKKQVCQEYNSQDCPHQGQLEIDHLIPLELGGADEKENLWVEYASYPNGPGFHVKDKLEDRLTSLVCKGQLSLTEAQSCIKNNWIECYNKIFTTTPYTYREEPKYKQISLVKVLYITAIIYLLGFLTGLWVRK